ncbi:MAG: hypothetical protein EXR08_07190 [Alphaproteobacteria bacterium]|nr:hypothetical protein [Alphaproteobacteria bacterium]
MRKSLKSGLLAVTAIMVAAPLSTMPARATLVAHFVDTPFPNNSSLPLGQFDSASITLNINPLLTNWIAWNNAPSVAIPHASCGVGEPNAGFCLGGAMDDYFRITITNPGGTTSAFNYDRNNNQNSPSGGTYPNFVDFQQNVIFGGADSAPDSMRVNFSNYQFFLDEAGVQDAIFTTAGNYTFNFDFWNEFAGGASHGNIYLLVDTPPPGSTPGDPILPAGPGAGGSGYGFAFDAVLGKKSTSIQ